MPVVLCKNGYRFMFFASDEDEPVHVHVKKNGKTAKFWLTPTVRLKRKGRFRPHEISEIERID
jgi:hypothetical protein